MTRHPRDLTFRKNDLVRAWKGALTAGIPDPVIKIDKHGTITIIPGGSPKDNGAGNPLDQWIANHADQTEGH
jgi:hypothetical protein